MKRALFALGLAIGLAVPPAEAAVSEEQYQQLLQRLEAQDRRIAELEAAQKQQAAAPAPTPAGAVAGAAVPAAPVAVAPAPASWTDKVAINGNFRYRYEDIDQEGSPAFNRQRIKAQAAIVAKPIEKLEVGMGITTSTNGDPTSTNITLGNGGSQKELDLNLAYFNWNALEGLNLLGGKFQNVLYRPAKYALLWDSDWNPEGFGATYKYDMFFANVLGTWLQSQTNASSGQEFTIGGQLGVNTMLGEVGKLTAGVGYYTFNTEGKGTFFGSTTNFQGNSFDPLTNTYLYDYNELELFGEFVFDVLGQPTTLFANYVNNADADDFDTGWVVGLAVGNAKVKNGWELSYAYQDLEADAVLALLTDSDFGGGGTDNKGSVIRGIYGLSDKTNVAATYFINTIDENVGDKADYNRLQLDLNFKY